MKWQWQVDAHLVLTNKFSRRSLPAEVDDIELKGLQLQFPSARTLDKKAQLYQVRAV